MSVTIIHFQFEQAEAVSFFPANIKEQMHMRRVCARKLKRALILLINDEVI